MITFVLDSYRIATLLQISGSLGVPWVNENPVYFFTGDDNPETLIHFVCTSPLEAFDHTCSALDA